MNKAFPTWMQAAIDLNPGYCGWGPGEDAMRIGETVPVDELWELDDFNECVSFYFTVLQAHDDCACSGTGLNPAAKKLGDSFYEGWGNHLTPDEMAALTAENRPIARSAANAFSRSLGHDAINRGILIKARHLRLHGSSDILCAACHGEGAVPRPGSRPRLAMRAWMLHPRKGASACLTVDPIREKDLPRVLIWLATAATRNAARFARVTSTEAFGASMERIRDEQIRDEEPHV